MKILAIIPARSGSKSIPDKNIISLLGKPLMAYSIEHALLSRKINRIIVSTDSPYYGDLARSFGAEVPFLRPAEIAKDDSTDFQVFDHALRKIDYDEGYRPDLVVHLRPTTPLRNPEDIDRMIDLITSHPEWDSVRSVAPAPETPYKMWFVEDGLLKPVIKDNHLFEPYNQPRQYLPKVYLQNASIDVARTRTILEKKSMTGNVIGSYIMDSNYDVDIPGDLNKVRQSVGGHRNKVFCFDIDGVIAHLTPDNDYSKAMPNRTTIEKINLLFENDNYLILFTARGSKTGTDWSEVTRQQMRDWGVKYHELRFGKPAADYYIDDRLINLEQL